MSKRFTDTDKFKKHFVRSLEPAYKLFWFYILDDCNHAGIWEVDFQIASIYCGTKIDPAPAREKFKGKYVEISNGTKWFIPDFILFQYGELNAENRAHNSVILLLSKYKLLGSYKVLVRGLQGRKDKDKDMDMDKEKDKVKEKRVIKEKSISGLCSSIFKQRYIDKTGLEYFWTAKDGAAMKSLTTKIKKSIEAKNGTSTDQEVEQTWTLILDHLPQWYLDNGFEPAVINSKYNSIIQQIKSKNGSDDDFDKQIKERLRKMGRARA